MSIPMDALNFDEISKYLKWGTTSINELVQSGSTSDERGKMLERLLVHDEIEDIVKCQISSNQQFNIWRMAL